MRATKFRFAPALALAIVAFAPLAVAQPKPPKSPKSAPAPEPPPPPPPVEVAPAESATPAPAAPAPAVVEPPSEDGSSSDVTEKPGKTYYYIGLRYRMDVVPKFMINLFVDEGATVFSNTLGIELDMRKDGFSFIPAISYVEYGTGDILFKEKGKPGDIAGNWSNVNSSLKAIYFTADLLWSTNLHKSQKFALDFEYGAGFGLGILTGGLETSWVTFDPKGPYAASDGTRFSPCLAEGAPNTGCNKADHQNSTVAKVNHYQEPSWANGGSKPNIFLHLSVPQVGFRFKATKEFEGRLGLGFSLTGFWFGLSGNYGLERQLEKSEPKSLATPTH